MNELPPGMAEDDELFSRRMLTQILGVVVASSMFVLALYLVGIIGSARDDDADVASTSVVAQLPPPGPTDDASSAGTDAGAPDDTTDSSTTTSGGAADPSSPSTSGTGPGATASSTEPTLASAPRIVGVTASDVRESSTDSCGDPTSYEPTLAVDSVRETAWMATGDGVGAALTIELGEPTIVSKVGLVPGYDKRDPCTGADRFDEFRRITQVRWTFDDGTSLLQTLGPTRSLQVITVDEPALASRITMTVVATTEPGDDRLDHTPVSEVVVS